eukprot:1060656-Prymnesium_polylepis.1
MAFHHPADPRKRAQKGKPGYDNYYQVRPTITDLKAVSEKMVVGGIDHAVDEQTIGHQGGAPAGVKQKCGRYKAAGDGAQNDAICAPGGYMNSFLFRGDTRAPSVSILGYGKKLCPTHQRCAHLPALTQSRSRLIVHDAF